MLLDILIACVVAGLIIWLLQQFPIDARVKQVGSVAVIVVLVLWLLKLMDLTVGSTLL